MNIRNLEEEKNGAINPATFLNQAKAKIEKGTSKELPPYFPN